MAQKLLPILIVTIFRLVTCTLRWRCVDHCGVTDPRNALGPLIWAFWHNRILGATAAYKRFIPWRRGSVLTSPSKDGEILARVMGRLGMGSVRGSSSRRGSHALMELMGVLQRGEDVAITPDGPRGPVYELAPGLIKLAELSGARIMPLRIEFARYWELKSWDGFRIPVPFSRAQVVFGPLYSVPQGADVEEERAKVKALLG